MRKFFYVAFFDLVSMTTIILILLFPLGELGRFNIYNEISSTFNDVLVGLLVVVWLTSLILRNKFTEVSKKQLAKPILIFIFVAFSSLIFNYNNLKPQEFLASFLYLLRFISYAGIYFIISEFDTKFEQKIVMLMLISGTLIVLGGFVQYFLYPSLRNLYYLGWDEHLYRLFSNFLDPNFAASIISLFLILLLSLLFLGYSKSQKTRIFLVLISIFAFAALLLTYSRSGYLMFFASVSTLLLILGRKIYIAILFVVFTIGIIILPKNLGGEGVKLLRTASILARSEYLNNAITIFKDNPIIGVGFNTYRYAQHRYGLIDESSLRVSHAGAGTDNSFLFVLATTGIVGFTFYLYMWYKILKTSRWALKTNARNKFEKAIACAVIASSVGLFVNAFFINSLFYPFVMEWMWILIALNSSTSSEFKESK